MVEDLAAYNHLPVLRPSHHPLITAACGTRPLACVCRYGLGAEAVEQRPGYLLTICSCCMHWLGDALTVPGANEAGARYGNRNECRRRDHPHKQGDVVTAHWNS